MKRLTKDAEKFDVMDLFTSMASEYGYKLDDSASQGDFIERIQNSFEKRRNNDITVYGKRAESLFAYVVGALGKSVLLKQEDSGALYSTDDELIRPDYRLILKNGKQILVEVKNFHNRDPSAQFTIKRHYFKKLKSYSDICGNDLMFAIYFSAWNHWALVAIDAFDENDNSYGIDFTAAMAKSEMSILGDQMIGTAPDLELHLLANEDEASTLDEKGQALFTTRKIKIFCAGNEIQDSLEQKIAFYLMRFGDWIGKDVEALFSNGKLLGMKFVFTPEDENEENFSFIGRLSSMVTNMFKEHTVKDGKVIAVSIPQEPEKFKVFIPDDYKGKDLPLWRFTMQANPDFKGLTISSSGRTKGRTAELKRCNQTEKSTRAENN